MLYENKAKKYSISRPGYAYEAINFIIERTHKECVVADIGAGTGILTIELAKNFDKVYAIEPNREMSDELLKKNISNIKILNTYAENTKLNDDSIDIICVAQAFHWFDEELFKKECSRILRDDGKIFIIHNVPPKEITSINIPNANDKTYDVNNILRDRKNRRRCFFGDDCLFKSFLNPITYDYNKFYNYIYSFSDVPNDSDIKKLIDSTIQNEFIKLSNDGYVTLNFITEIYTFNK